MSATTSIEWTDRTWNPATGCTKVSPGCKHCYAEAVAERFWAKQYPPTGDTAHPPTDEVRQRRFTDVWTHPDRLDEPLRWGKPARIFVNSMSDLFHEDVPDQFIAEVFGVMAAAPRHTFQVLTKRPERALRWFAWAEAFDNHGSEQGPLGALAYAISCSSARLPDRTFGGEGDEGVMLGRAIGNDWPLRNVHLGVSVENQETADERIPMLLQTPAAVRFLSVEPLLGPVDLGWLWPMHRSWKAPYGSLREAMEAGAWVGPRTPQALCGPGARRIDWVIVGGESGPGARPCDIAWIRSIVGQCGRAGSAGVPCFVKQLGAMPTLVEVDLHEWPTASWTGLPGANIGVATLRDRKGGDPAEWPEDLRVREFPEARP